ncbi:MAG: carboxymuconolactone decarboxylase family protein [Burkholderiaceae bacterium]
MSHEPLMNYFAAAPAATNALVAFAKTAGAKLDRRLAELVNLRVSQINGCAFCMDMHSHDLLGQGVDPRALATLAGWREARRFFSPRECAALAWAESVNAIPSRVPSEEEFAALREHFKESEIAELTLAVCAIRSFNALNASFRTQVPEKPYTGA